MATASSTPAAKTPTRRRKSTSLSATAPAPLGDYLSVEEKRRMLAHMVRVNVVALLDEHGNLCLDKVREIHPACIQELNITTTERSNREGGTTSTTLVKLKIVDRLRALEMDTDLSAAAPLSAAAESGSSSHAEEAARHQRVQRLLSLIPGHSTRLLGASEGADSPPA